MAYLGYPVVHLSCPMVCWIRDAAEARESIPTKEGSVGDKPLPRLNVTVLIVSLYQVRPLNE